MGSRHVVFVLPFCLPATLRFVAGAAGLAGVRLSVVSQDPLEKLPQAVRARLVGHWRVDDALDAAQLVAAVHQLAARNGPVERLIGTLEQLQVPLAVAAAQLGLPGLGVETARNFRDKHRMKARFDAAGVPCARHALVDSADAARACVARVGFPVVVKPPDGAGARNTFRLDSRDALEHYLSRSAPRAAAAVLFEEFLAGEEHSFDSVTLAGKPVWHSINVYRPAPLTVVENPWIQWCVLSPREVDAPAFDAIRAIGPQAIAALGLHTGMTHMEWFRRSDGSTAISEIAARPPGAQFTSLLSWACGADFYAAWPRLMIFDEFVAPPRTHAVGAAYLRGMGTGTVAQVQGVQALQREFGALMVEAEWPRPGAAQPPGYEGAGYVIFRHPETAVVERALRRTVELIRVKLV